MRHVGHSCVLRYRNGRYELRVLRTGPKKYRVTATGTVADIAVEHVDAYQRRVIVGGRRHRIVVIPNRPTCRIEVDGVAHTVVRDDGGIVRSGWPAFVVAVLVAPGQRVAEGERLVVLESMKMESAVTAPYAGEVVSVDVAVHSQIDAGVPLLRVRATGDGLEGEDHPARLDLGGLAAPEPAGAPPCERVFEALRAYLMGYDLDPADLHGLLVRQRRLGELAAPAHAGLMRCEDGLLDLFADIGMLYRPHAGSEPSGGSSREYLLSYLQWLDADRSGLPQSYRERLGRVLRQYGVEDLARTPELERAVVRMFRSFRRVDDLVPAVIAILERRLASIQPQPSTVDSGALRDRLDRLVEAGQGRHPLLADLARDMRFRYLDEPLLAAVVEEENAAVEAHLAALRQEPDQIHREQRVARLVSSPQPLRGQLLRHWLAEGCPGFRAVLLEVYIRRYYRTEDTGPLIFDARDGYQLCTTEYARAGRQIHLVTAYAPLAELPALSRAVAAHLRASTGPDRDVIVDVATWREGEPPDLDDLAATVGSLLSGCAFGRPLWRLDMTVTSADGIATEHLRTQHLTYHQHDGTAFTEEPLYRNLHPMLAERLELWRMGNFTLRRLNSAEDIYLFHGIANENPDDQRLFALAEVRDVTGVFDAASRTSYPRLELLGLRALSAMREAAAGFPEAERPTTNRIVLYVRPLWSVPHSDWPVLTRSFAPLAAGAGLEKVVLRVRVPDGKRLRDTVLHIEGLDGGGVTVRECPPGRDPVRPLTPYRQKVLRAQRAGAPYPYEIVRMLAPPPGALSRFPTGHFTGQNQAHIVVGLIANNTAKVPDGMTRVVLFGDPTRGRGNVAEPECRRIIAALDLAERMGLPVEWFAVSSGARIAMDSGTENMDWVAAVLRRLVEFTQRGGTVNVVVTGVNVGAQPYWNAEATMLMHTRGILVMTPASAMVLTGRQALAYSGGVSAEDNHGIGGFDRIMGPNGQGQYWAPTLEDACTILLRHYEHTYVVPGERHPRRAVTADPIERDVSRSPHPDAALPTIGHVLSAEHNADRKQAFNIRAVLRSVTDADSEPLERWRHWRGAETAVVWDAHIGGIPVCLVGFESTAVPRHGFVPADGPTSWTPGTLFPQSSRKIARAVNAASRNRPLVVLANLSGFDGSPESMRHWQLEYGAEIGRAVTNFRGPIVFVVVSRYHGGAFVVFSKRLNESMQVAAIAGSYASVIGGAPAAATVFARDVKTRTEHDPRVRALADKVHTAPPGAAADLRTRLADTAAAVRAEKLGEVAAEFDAVHTIERARAAGSVDCIIAASELRPYLVSALERGMAASACSIRASLTTTNR
jgi:acetyl-CoA carboxylase carboxyltransferase component/biotin carboxyl carrier protein